jgi:hypothetical protein
MTEGKKGTTGKKGSKKLTLKKETLKDLDARKTAKGVKGGGVRLPTAVRSCPMVICV